MTRDELEAYAGDYRFANGGVIRVAAGSKGLVFSSADLEAAKELHALPAHQQARRDELLAELPTAFERALDGELKALHALLDPFTPLDEFAAMHMSHMQRMTAENGAFKSAWTVPAATASAKSRSCLRSNSNAAKL